MACSKPRPPVRTYVKVTSDFDSTGYMQPRAITWKDGRVFRIDAVKDLCPARRCERYTVVIKPHPKHAHGTTDLGKWSNGTKRIIDAMMTLYDEKVDPRLLVRRVNIAAVNLIREDEIPEDLPRGVTKEQLSFFDNFELDTEEEKKSRTQKAAEEERERKERSVQKATLAMQAKYGKNAILKGTNFLEGATTRDRNMQIGGHRSGEAGEAEKQRKLQKKT